MARAILPVLICAASFKIAACSNTTGFVKRQGSVLLLDSQLWRFSGCNMFWLGVTPSCNPGTTQDCIHYPSQFQIKDAFDTIAGLGFNAVRSHSMGISSGYASHGLALHPNGSIYNKRAFETIDYAVYQATLHGMRLIVPFTDNWFFYHGGFHDFVQFRGYNCSGRWLMRDVPMPGNPCYQFFVNPDIIGDFKHYIQVLLTHTNPYTGRALKDEPAILAWETGNELLIEGPVFSNWTEHIASYVKQELGAKQLIMDGRNQGRHGIDPTALANPSVDMITEHYYVPWEQAIQDIHNHGNATANADKVFVIGEYGAANNETGLAQFLSVVETTEQPNGKPLVAGDLWWSFFPHGDTYGFVPHDDSWTLHYPSDDKFRQQVFDATVTHTHVMQGKQQPSRYPAVIGQPVMTNATQTCADNCTTTLSWRGATFAFAYDLQVSGDNRTFTTLCSKCYTDHDTPVLTSTIGADVDYVRVVPYNRDGLLGSAAVAIKIA